MKTYSPIYKNRYFHYFLLFVISVVFASTYSKIYDVKPDLNGDNIYYYSLGKALSEGKGFTDIMQFKEVPHTHFPPGYPVFIAGIMKIFPGNLTTLKIVNGFLLYLSVILLFFLLRKISASTFLSFICCLLFCMHATLLRYATIVMSEMLFLLSTVITIYLVLKIDVKQLFSKQGIKDNILFLILIFIINYIYFIRTMGTSIILAVVFYFGLLFLKEVIGYLKSSKIPATDRSAIKNLMFKYGLVILLLFGTFIGVKTAWDIRNRNAGSSQSDYLNDFKKKPNGQTMTTWEDWNNRIKSNFDSYLTKWVPSSILSTSYDINKKTTSGEWFRGICVAAFIILGLIRLKQGSLLLFLYLGITMAVLIVWPEQYGGLRYFVGIIPFFIFLFLYGLKEALVLLFALRKRQLPVLAQILPIIIFALFLMVPQYTKALNEQKEMAKYKTWNTQNANAAFVEFKSAIEWCSKNLSDTARVICRKPEVFYMYSGGKKAGGFSHYGKPEDIFNSFVKNRATHVIVDHWFRHAYVTLYPLITDYYPENFKFICQFGGKTPQEAPTLIFEFNPDWGYTGERTDGKRQGQGKLVMQDGRVYMGTFKDNQINGYGELYGPKGELIAKGIWENNSLTKPQ